MADRTDHELLILIEDHVKGMKDHLGKLNEKVNENKSTIGCLQGCFKAMQVEIKNLKQRPSAFRAVLAVGAVLAALMTVFQLVKL